jgi:hypothetical protein
VSFGVGRRGSWPLAHCHRATVSSDAMSIIISAVAILTAYEIPCRVPGAFACLVSTQRLTIGCWPSSISHRVRNLHCKINR